MGTHPTESRVTLTSPDGVHVPGIITTPEAPPSAYVLLLHGITTHKDEYGNYFAVLARSLAGAGIASLRIDFRGHGDSPESPLSFTVASQVLDTLTAVDWLRSTFHVPRVSLFSCSFGAPPAVFAATIRPAAIASVMLLCPVLDYSRTFLAPTTEWASALFTADAIKAAFLTGSLRMNDTMSVGVKLLVEMHLIKPYDCLRSLRLPCLIIHGDADSMVPYAVSVLHTMGLSNIDFICIADMDHGYTHKDDDTGTSDRSQANYTRILNELVAQIRSTL